MLTVSLTPWPSLFGLRGVLRTLDEHPSEEELERQRAADAQLAADRAQLEALVERLMDATAEKLRNAADDDAVLAEIDALVASGTLARYMRPLMALAARTNLLAQAAELAAKPIDTSQLSPTAAALFSEGMETQRTIFAALHGILVEVVADAQFDELLLEAQRAPMSYLSDAPVELAELMLAADRGRIAGLALIGRSIGARDVSLARLYRDGARAEARLLATLAPSLVPEAIVPSSERLDLKAIQDRDLDADERADALFAAADASGEPVYEPAHDA